MLGRITGMAVSLDFKLLFLLQWDTQKLNKNLFSYIRFSFTIIKILVT